jgi:hypothetical protein
MVPRKTGAAVVECVTASPPPYWALLERELMRAVSRACPEFHRTYFDSRGYLLCNPRWGALDGPDDALENVGGWTMFHALGGPDEILGMYKHALEGHMRQYTEAKTVDVPFAKDGMYYKEFPVMFDFVHTGEGFSPLFDQGLSDPGDLTFQKRMRRFSGFYMNEDPQAPNYDPKHKIIKSLFNGSRGPLLRKATPVDWAGDRVEIENRFHPLRGERNYEHILEHFHPHTDIVGDSPCNLPITVMPLLAYMTSGEEKYRAWILEYVDAWVQRCKDNGGLIPSNIGLDGSIGGECGGKWWGGTYGWGFTCTVPTLVHRPFFNGRSFHGFGAALLLTGDRGYIDVWRTVIRTVNENKKREGGKDLYPHMYGDNGWYDYTTEPFMPGAMETYFWSMDRQKDLPLVAGNPWISWLEGGNPDYPVKAFTADLEAVRKRVALMRADTRTPDTRMSEELNAINPAINDALAQLTLGAIPPHNDGCPLQCAVRYFDPERRRAGLPEDVAALVDRVTENAVGLQLVNVSTTEWKTLVVQGGAFAQNRIEKVTLGDMTTEVGNDHFLVRLAPGAACRLVLEVTRYANRPNLAFPWV